MGVWGGIILLLSGYVFRYFFISGKGVSIVARLHDGRSPGQLGSYTM